MLRSWCVRACLFVHKNNLNKKNYNKTLLSYLAQDFNSFFIYMLWKFTVFHAPLLLGDYVHVCWKTKLKRSYLSSVWAIYESKLSPTRAWFQQIFGEITTLLCFSINRPSIGCQHKYTYLLSSWLSHSYFVPSSLYFPYFFTLHLLFGTRLHKVKEKKLFFTSSMSLTWVCCRSPSYLDQTEKICYGTRIDNLIIQKIQVRFCIKL
jgi:hypothetical protein